ncbi:MAG: DHH family phosphoesterase, partial [Anaerolineaceae bacterium]|nr:DHH family phosphoesterase [Anaerolineaceae bacterium]
MKKLHQIIQNQFDSAKNIAIVTHVRPDGDAIGSLLGLGLTLQDRGKLVQMVSPDGVPTNFRYLSGSSQVKCTIETEPDLLVTVDCSDLQRGGSVLADRIPGLNIDHHLTNLNFGEVNLVEPNAVATCAILAQYLPHWNFPISRPVAEALLTGVVSDTIGFRTPNVTPQALRLAATLIEHGASLSALYHHALVRRSFEAARYWGMALERLQREGRIIWTTLTLTDREEAAYPGNDDADLVNLLSTVDDTDIVVLFVEQKGGHVKVSWRAQPGLDVSQIALRFNGGGHPAAAGADIP